MNERIEGLWWKARIGYNNQNCDPEVVEKFAELIVRECADWINDNVGMIDEEARQDLLKHFGVEEWTE